MFFVVKVRGGAKKDALIPAFWDESEKRFVVPPKFGA
jgi:hypothetical protein